MIYQQSRLIHKMMWFTLREKPPQMFSIEWETPLTDNDESSDNAKLFQSVSTLPT